MAKEVATTPQTEQDEVIVRAPRPTGGYALRSKADTKTVVVAVGASIVLFTIGLILGYLLGHQNASTSRGGFDNSMMNGNMRYFQNRMQN